LDHLRAFHAHLFGNSGLTIPHSDSRQKIEFTVSPNRYLLKEKEQLERALAEWKSKHTYRVLTTYSDPSTFVKELKLYYQERISKLRRRTRTKV